MDRKTVKIIITTAVLCIIATVLLVVFVIPWAGTVISSWGSNEVMATLTLVGVAIAVLVPYIELRLAKRQSKKDEQAAYQIDIQVDTSLPDNMVLFSASIQNVGEKQIETKTSNLYIDQGIPVKLTNDRDSSDVGAKSFQFPFILEHRENIDGRPDCVLCKKCFRGNDDNYPEEIVDNAFKQGPSLLRTHIVLEHLSHKSVQYINPKERFSEDVVVQFKDKGVYRVTFFVGTEGEADCSCATKQFYISESLTPPTSARNRNRGQQQTQGTAGRNQQNGEDVT